jgi:hypothetical protein
MTKQLDTPRRRRTARRDLSGLGAFLGGSELADAERAYEELQTAFAQPLRVPRRMGRNSGDAEDGRAAPRAYDDPEGLLGHIARPSVQLNKISSGTQGGQLEQSGGPSRQMYPRHSPLGDIDGGSSHPAFAEQMEQSLQEECHIKQKFPSPDGGWICIYECPGASDYVVHTGFGVACPATVLKPWWLG